MFVCLLKLFNLSEIYLKGGRALTRPIKGSPSPVHSIVDTAGYAPIHYTGAGARQSPISPNMMGHMGARHALPMIPVGMQRTSPGTRKTPPMMNLGPMTEVPYPSQASLPEETPIIRMSKEAAIISLINR